MARWRLTAPHYLMVQGTNWEYKEVDRKTGRPQTVRFPVPTLLDPNDVSYWTHREGPDFGMIIVSNGNKSDPADIIFVGDPTPDMVPLDDEAKEISASFAEKWNLPVNLPDNYSEVILDTLQKELDDVRTKSQTVQLEGMAEMLGAMTQMMQQNQAIIAALTKSETRR